MTRARRFASSPRIVLVIVLVIVAMLAAACAPTPSDSPLPTSASVGADVIHFTCLEQLDDRIRATPCRLDVNERAIETIVEDTESVAVSGPTIAPDRRHVAVLADVDPTSSDEPSAHVVVDAASAPVMSVEVSGHSLDQAWTSSSDALVTASDSGFVISPLGSDASRHVALDPPAQPYLHAVSPDGTMIAAAVDSTALTDGPSRLVVHRLDDGTEVSSVDVDAISSIAWSPDGRVAAGSGSGLHVLEPSTGVSTIIGAPSDDRFFGVAWSHDGAQLAAIVGSTLVVYDTASWQPTPLTPDEMIAASGPPAWSPDGTRLVVAALGGADRSLPHLFLVDTATGTIDDLTPQIPTHQGFALPVWS